MALGELAFAQSGERRAHPSMNEGWGWLAILPGYAKFKIFDLPFNQLIKHRFKFSP